MKSLPPSAVDISITAWIGASEDCQPDRRGRTLRATVYTTLRRHDGLLCSLQFAQGDAMRELCERLRKFQEQFERGQGRKMTPEELSYLEAAQELIDGGQPQESDE